MVTAIGDTPLRVLHHQGSGCILVLAEDNLGQSWLHLLQAGTLLQASTFHPKNKGPAFLPLSCSLQLQDHEFEM